MLEYPGLTFLEIPDVVKWHDSLENKMWTKWSTSCNQTHFYTIWISLYINKDYSSKMHERHLPVSYFVWKDLQEKVFSEHNWGLQNFIWANQAYVQAKKQMKGLEQPSKKSRPQPKWCTTKILSEHSWGVPRFVHI